MTKKYDFTGRKSIHIHLEKSTHSDFRTLLFKKSLSMQEVFEEFAERLVSGDKWTERLLNDCIHKKHTGERKIAAAEAEDLYSIIQESTK